MHEKVPAISITENTIEITVFGIGKLATEKRPIIWEIIINAAQRTVISANFNAAARMETKM